MIMATQFESLLHIRYNNVFCSTGITGIFALLVMKDHKMASFIRIIKLTGIVVNNAIILVDYINVEEKGLDRRCYLKRGRQNETDFDYFDYCVACCRWQSAEVRDMKLCTDGYSCYWRTHAFDTVDIGSSPCILYNI